MKYKTLIQIKEIIDQSVNMFGEYQALDKDLRETMDFDKILKMVDELNFENKIAGLT